MNRYRFLVIAAAVAITLGGRALMAAAADEGPVAAPRIAVFPAPAKIRPSTPALGAAAIELTLMRGECETVHVAVQAGAAPLTGVKAALRGKAGPGVTVRLYREGLVELLRASGPDGEAGAWPDPLIPDVDAYAGEHRKAFPFDVPAGESRAIAVQACADRKARPGRRTAGVAVQAGGEHLVPLRMTVSEVTIPATSTLPTSFGLASRTVALGHLGRKAQEPKELLHFNHLYRKALLAYRISTHGGTWDPPPFRRGAGGISVDFRDYDRELSDFLTGPGPQLTSVDLRTHPDLKTEAEKLSYWKAQADHLQKLGYRGVLFSYEKDEPKLADLPEIAGHARLVRKADPRIRVLLTASLSAGLAGLVDIWTPNLNCLFVRNDPGEFCPWRAGPAEYGKVRADGASLWWYQSCSSHGCDDAPPGPYFRGWPSYVVDAAGGRARAMGWLAFAWGIEGELYWATTHGYTKGDAPADPWAPGGLWAFGGNGDGTLLYPGTPERIGGHTHVPVESLRLVMIRDGLEDLELLRLVAARPGGKEVALAEARRIAPTPYDITADPGAFDAARARLLAFLSGARPE